jgi:hypothetical protein
MIQQRKQVITDDCLLSSVFGDDLTSSYDFLLPYHVKINLTVFKHVTMG